MSDVFNDYVNNPASVPAQVRSIIAAMPRIQGGGTSLCLSDAALRQLLNVLASLG